MKKISQRIIFEIKYFIKLIIKKSKQFFLMLINLHKSPLIRKKNTAIYVWDPTHNSITFDFICCLYSAFNEISQYGFNTFELIIYLPKGYKLKPFDFQQYSSYISSEDMHRRINNLILPLARSCNCVSGIKVIESKKKLYKEINPSYKLVIPLNYSPNFFQYTYKNPKKHFRLCSREKKPIKFQGLIEKKKNYRYFKELDFKNRDSEKNLKKYITLTLRDYGYQPMRNSDDNDILIAYEFAKLKKADLIIVPDVIQNISNYKIPKGVKICREARLSIEERISLYKNSLVNLFSNSGTSSVSIYTHNSKAIIFKHGNGDPNDFYSDYSPAHFKRFYGLNVGDQPFLAFDTYFLWFDKNKPYGVDELCKAWKILENQ